MSYRGRVTTLYFSPTLVPIIETLTTSLSDKERIDAEQTLLAIREFTRYLQKVEKDLSGMSKKLRNKEIAQSVGFVGSGIHEALQYLSIVRKVIGKTQRLLQAKGPNSKEEIGDSVEER